MVIRAPPILLRPHAPTATTTVSTLNQTLSVATTVAPGGDNFSLSTQIRQFTLEQLQWVREREVLLIALLLCCLIGRHFSWQQFLPVANDYRMQVCPPSIPCCGGVFPEHLSFEGEEEGTPIAGRGYFINRHGQVQNRLSLSEVLFWRPVDIVNNFVRRFLKCILEIFQIKRRIEF